MKDDEIDHLLKEWGATNLPAAERREETIRRVLNDGGSEVSVSRRTRRNPMPLAALATTALVLLVCTVFVWKPIERNREIAKPQEIVKVPPKPESIRVSLLVLERQGETAVEFLEDTILTTKEQEVRELSVGRHKLFFWFLALEPSVFSFDVGIDDVAETGIVAVPDKTKAVHLTSGDRRFDVFVSIL